METIGSYLRQQRERAGVSLEQVSKSTKIRVALLTSLEADRFDDLPGGVFVRGFVRAYSGAVGIRPDRAMELLDGQVEPTPAEATYSSPLDGQEESGTRRLKLAHMLVLACAILSLLGAYFVLAGPEKGRTSVSATETTDVDSGTTKAFSPRHQPRP
jgi:cytoskeletal protein RodZ